MSKVEKVLPPPRYQLIEISMMIQALKLQKPEAFTVDDRNHIREYHIALRKILRKVKNAATDVQT